MMAARAGRERIAAAQAELLRQGASLLVVGLSASMRYLAGFSDEPGERLFVLCVPARGDALLIVPELYEGQVRSMCGDLAAVSWADAAGPTQALRAAMKKLVPSGTVLVDDSLWASFLLALERELPECRFASGGDAVAALRMTKDADEVSRLEKAGACADRAYAEVTETKFAGCTEIEIAARLEAAMIRAGADEPAFKTLVAAGPNAAMPHYRAGHRRIAPGDVVILDFGCRVDGYCSDISRTVVCGAAPPDVLSVHAAVREAQERAIEVVRPGAMAGDVDRAARTWLTQAGYGREFVHRTGHGIGLDIHEPPYISEGSSVQLEAGMSFSVEPGVYVAGRFGVRIEDVVVVTRDGARRMTSSARELAAVL